MRPFKQRNRSKRQQQGFVSLFTVIFFTLLITVITVGFVSIVLNEQQQSLNNDLRASALNAAESGIEDAKRAILYYNSLPAGSNKNALYSTLTSNQCDALTNSTIAQGIGVSSNGAVTSQNNLSQYFTCLTVNLVSPNYLASSSADKSVFIPLNSQNNAAFDQLVVSWHLVSSSVGASGDGQPTKYVTSTTTLPPVAGSGSSWSSQGYPAYLRVQLYGYPSTGNFTRNDISDRSRSAFLVPGAVGTTSPISFDTADPLPHQFDTNKLPLQAIKCSGTPPNVPSGTYACTATLQLPSGANFASTANNYFLRVTPLYGSTHFSVTLKNSSSGNAISFSGVEPIVDVTGRAGNVFRRVQSRVVIGAATDLPEFEVETAGDICKNMVVSDGSYFQANNCP